MKSNYVMTQLDHTMLRFAKNRVVVMLDTGVTCRLVCWRIPGRRQMARVEFPSGGRTNVSIRQVAGIVGEDGGTFPMPRDLEGGNGQDRTEDVHVEGGGGSCRDHVPDAGLLAPNGGGAPEDDGAAGVGESPVVHGRGSDAADGGRDAVQERAGDPA